MVRVNIDQARHDGVFGEVDLSVAGLLRRGGRRRNGSDAVTSNDDGLAGELGAGLHVKEVTGAKERAERGGRGLRNGGEGCNL